MKVRVVVSLLPLELLIPSLATRKSVSCSPPGGVPRDFLAPISIGLRRIERSLLAGDSTRDSALSGSELVLIPLEEGNGNEMPGKRNWSSQMGATSLSI